MTESKVETTYQVTFEGSGRVWTLRPLPKHFYLMFAHLPSSLTEKAAAALKSGEQEDFRDEIMATLTPQQILGATVMAREAVNYACVTPRIVLSPQKPDEISAFEVTEEEFKFLVNTVMRGDSPVAEKFRGEPKLASLARPRRKKH